MKIKVNYLQILGIVIIAIGTFLIYSGAKLDSDQSQNEITKKLDIFNNKLKEVKNSKLNDEDKLRKIDTIKNEFDEWAKNLNSNLAEVELSNEKKKLSHAEKTTLRRKKFSTILSSAYQDISLMVTSIQKEIPSAGVIYYSSNRYLPTDFFTDSANNYYQVIKFTPNQFIKINSETLWKDREKVSISFNVYNAVSNSKNKFALTDDILDIGFLDDFFYIQKGGTFKNLFLDNEKSYYSFNELKIVIKQIITYQYVSSKKAQL